MTHRTKNLTRREFLRGGAALGAGLTVMRAFGKAGPDGVPAETSSGMPMITLGGFRVSRLILGSNPFWGFWHGNPRKPKPFTREGRKAVMEAAAGQGLTAIWTPGYNEWIALWNEYKDKGGKLETWIGQPDGYEGVSLEDQITACAKNGGSAVCVQGENVDAAVKAGDFDRVKRWLGLIRGYGMPAGLASHMPGTILKLEDLNLPVDFYHLTLGVPNSFENEDRERTLETIRQIDKPMVVFKVIGAGRFNPQVDLPYVLKTIRRKDGLCIGVDNPDQLAENAELVRRLTHESAS
jgi:hypothetical protein